MRMVDGSHCRTDRYRLSIPEFNENRKTSDWSLAIEIGQRRFYWDT